MNTAEIVVGKMQGHGSFQMRQFLAVGIREARKSSHRHSHGQVLPFYKRGADMVRVGIALSNLGYNPRDAWWGVPRFGRIELPVVAEHLRELREVAIRSEAFRNADGVVIQSVCGELYAIGHALMQVPQEGPRIGTNALADAKRRHQFGLRVNRNVNPLVANFGRVAASHVAPFFATVRPNLINLQIPGVEVPHSRVHQSGTAFASDKQEAHDRVPIQSSEPFGAADRAALKKALQRPCSGIRAGTHGAKRRSGLRFAEGCTTGIAAPALNAALTEVTESLAGLVLASETGHGFSPLDFCAELSHNEFGSGLWFTPRFGLALPTALTGDRAVSCYLTSWWRSGHGLLPRFSCRAASLQRLRDSYLGPKSILLARKFVGAKLLNRRGPCIESFFLSLFSYFVRCRELLRSRTDSQADPLVFDGPRTQPLIRHHYAIFNEPVNRSSDRSIRRFIRVNREAEFFEGAIDFTGVQPFLAGAPKYSCAGLGKPPKIKHRNNVYDIGLVTQFSQSRYFALLSSDFDFNLFPICKQISEFFLSPLQIFLVIGRHNGRIIRRV